MKPSAALLDAPFGGFARNEHTISLVRERFDLVTPIAPQVAALFCANLFEADPRLKPLFKGDMVVHWTIKEAAVPA